MEIQQNSTAWLQGLGPIQNHTDIDWLIDKEMPEGDHLEFKQDLSVPKGHPIAWKPGTKLHRDAKKQLLQEVVAFANAYGGTLLLGIVESDMTPAVAAQVQALPHCVALAEHLKMVFRDSVDPPLPYLQINPILTEEEEGIIVIHAGRSYLSPHRVAPTRECPIRRADRCENMTMREIQDMCMNTARGLERLEKQLAARAQRFQDKEVAVFSMSGPYVALRFTAVPTVDIIGIDPVFQRGTLIEALNPSGLTVQWQIGEVERTLSNPFLSGMRSWRPMLRAARTDVLPITTTGRSNYIYNDYAEVHSDGLVEIGHISNFGEENPGTGYRLILLESSVLEWASYVLAWADQVRCQAHAPLAEYVLNVEFTVQGAPCFMPTGIEEPHSAWRNAFLITPTKQVFPSYHLRDIQDLGEIISKFRRDLWNWQGQEVSKEAGFSLVKT